MGNTDVVLQAGQERVSLEAMGSVSEAGRFEVDAITAGVGNGWKFSEEVLQASVDLWGGVECFVDHGGFWGGRSVRDLGGVFRETPLGAGAQSDPVGAADRRARSGSGQGPGP